MRWRRSRGWHSAGYTAGAPGALVPFFLLGNEAPHPTQGSQVRDVESPEPEPGVQSLVWEDPLQEGMAIVSSIPAWRGPWPEEPGRLQSIGMQRVEHNRVTQPASDKVTTRGRERA